MTPPLPHRTFFSPFQVVNFVWEPSIMYRRAPDGSLESRYGVDIDAISLLSHAMNFTVRYVEPAEG